MSNGTEPQKNAFVRIPTWLMSLALFTAIAVLGWFVRDLKGQQDLLSDRTRGVEQEQAELRAEMRFMREDVIEIKKDVKELLRTGH